MRLVKKVALLCVFLFCLGQFFAFASTAQEYFDDATAKYITGDLAGALADLKAVLRLAPKHAGARELMKSIKRELALNAPVVAAPTDQIGANNYYVALFILFNLLGFLAIAALVFLIRYFFGQRTRPEEPAPKIEGFFCPHCHSKLNPNTETCPYCGVRVGVKMWHSVSEEQRLWYSKMRWHKNPFALEIHAELFTGYKKEVKEVLEKISARSGHILIVGDLGVGKTTMLRWLSSNMPRQLNPIYIPRPPQDFAQLIRFISDSVGFSPRHAADYNIYNLNKFCRKLKKGLVLLLDEAHEFTLEIERPLRTLGDLDDVLLILGGLPETIEKFKTEIPPLYERLVLKLILSHLPSEDLAELIKVRIEEAGGTGLHPFTTAAVTKIFELSEGVPRRALKLCDNAITQAINSGEDKITPNLIG